MRGGLVPISAASSVIQAAGEMAELEHGLARTRKLGLTLGQD